MRQQTTLGIFPAFRYSNVLFLSIECFENFENFEYFSWCIFIAFVMPQTIGDFRASFNEALEKLCNDKGDSNVLIDQTTAQYHNSKVDRSKGR